MLTISSKVLADIIQSLGSTNFETGGLIGSSAEIIDTFHFDKGMSESVSEYIPNVDALKQQLSDWQKNGIAFKGFIHSHLMSGELSLKDIHMAYKVLRMNKMTSLLMPIYVMSTNEIIWNEIKHDGVVLSNMSNAYI